MPHRPTQTNNAWLTLRTAVAEEYVTKLPELLPMDEFARLTGLTLGQVRHATTTGALVVSLREGRRGIAPADNIAFLLRERLLLLPLPAPVSGPRPLRELEVSAAAYERIWDEAVRSKTSPEEALDRLLHSAPAKISASGRHR